MKTVISSLCVAAALLLGAMQAAQAVQPDEVLADPALEGRAREISQELRCLVCQNQSIDDSNAELAKDLRVIVRERLVEGDSDEEVLDFVVARYGDYVLLRPPVKPETYALWFGPAAILLIAATGIFFWMRRQSREAVAEAGKQTVQASGLNAAEQARLAALMNEDDTDRESAGGNRKG